MIGPPGPYMQGGMKFLQWLEGNITSRSHVSLKNDEVRSFVCIFDVIKVIAHVVGISVGCLESICGPDEKVTSSDNSTQQSTRIREYYNTFGCFITPINDDTSTGKQHNVYNVGGPDPLSRYELALLVASAMHVEMEVSPEATATTAGGAAKRLNAKENVWQVSSVPSASMTSIVASPRNVAMNSSVTENDFNMKFTPLKNYLATKYTSI